MMVRLTCLAVMVVGTGDEKGGGGRDEDEFAKDYNILQGYRVKPYRVLPSFLIRAC